VPSELIEIPVPLAIGGLNKDIEPTLFQYPFSPNMKNMQLEPTKVRKRLGYSELGSNLPLSGTGMELIQYVDARGNVHLIALTTTLAYEYDEDDEQWDVISNYTAIDDCEDNWDDTDEENVTVTYDASVFKEGTKSVKMAISGGDMGVGDKIAYSDDYLPTLDISAAGTGGYISYWLRSSYNLTNAAISLVVTEATGGAKAGVENTNYVRAFCPAMSKDTWTKVTVAKNLTNMTAIKSVGVYSDGGSFPAGENLWIDGIETQGSYSGSADDRWSHTIATDASEFSNNGGSALVITNNNATDICLYYEGQAGDKFQTLATGIGSFAGAKEVIEFWNHLFFLNYNDGNQNVRSYKYAVAGDVDNFDGATAATGTLTDSVGKIMRAKKLGADLIIYSQNSITTCRYVGGNYIFVFPTLVFETGLYAEKGIWDFVNTHYFVGTDQKIYGYQGGKLLQQVGKPIEDSFFSELNVSNKIHIVVGVDPGRHKVHFFFPGSSDTYAKNTYTLNYKTEPLTWEYHEFYHTIRDFSLFSNKVAWRCNGTHFSGVTCNNVAIACDDSYSQTDYPQATFLTDDGYVFIIDEALGSDSGENIECIYQTQDVTLDEEHHQARGLFFSFNAKSTLASATVTVEYQADGGSWTEFAQSPISLNADWTQHRLECDVVFRRIAVKFTQNSTKDFQLRHQMRWEVVPRGKR
jgi:hypothetical protein